MTEPALAEKVTGKGRMYRDPRDRELVPSITNCIDLLAKPWLAGWAAKLVAGEAYDQRAALMQLDDREQAVDMLKGAPYRKRNAAAGVGDVIHAYAESLFTDEPQPEFGPEHEPFIGALLDFINEYKPVFEIVEGTVFSPIVPGMLRYGGTFDWLGTVGGRRVLADWKTGSGIYDEVALQLAAGRYAEVVWDRYSGDLAPMPHIDGCLAIHVRPGKFAVHVIDAGEAAFGAFLGLRAAWPWEKDHDGAVGPRMNLTRLVKELSSGAVEGGGVSPLSPVSPTGTAPDESSPAPRAGTKGEGREKPLTAKRMAVPSPAGEPTSVPASQSQAGDGGPPGPSGPGDPRPDTGRPPAAGPDETSPAQATGDGPLLLHNEQEPSPAGEQDEERLAREAEYDGDDGEDDLLSRAEATGEVAAP